MLLSRWGKFSMKTFIHPTTGQKFKLGRNRPLAKGPRFKIKNYMLASLPTPPLSIDYTTKAQPFLSDILGNDETGDCTCAGIFHAIGCFLGNADEPIPFTAADTMGLYSRCCGYIPGDDDTDQGGDEQTVLNYVQNNGLLPDGSHKIAVWMAVDATNKMEVMQAIYLAENVYFGVELPDAYVAPFPSASGFTWGMAGPPNRANGHCFVGLGYTPEGVLVDSWGLLGTMTWQAVASYASRADGGELYTVLSRDALIKASQKAPNGFDFSQLLADIDSMG